MLIDKPSETALLLVDMQNDFLHPQGAYSRGGAAAPALSVLPETLKPAADAARDAGVWIVATQFTLVPGRMSSRTGRWVKLSSAANGRRNATSTKNARTILRKSCPERIDTRASR